MAIRITDFSYRRLCESIEWQINHCQSHVQIPTGSLQGIFSSAALSFGANIVMSRFNLRTSFQAAGAAIAAKLVQLTLVVGQKHFSKKAETDSRSIETKPYLSSQDCYAITALALFYFRKITSPSIDP